MSIAWNYLDKRSAAMAALKDYRSMKAILATEYSARDCAARPLKLSIHSGGIEHACRRR